MFRPRPYQQLTIQQYTYQVLPHPQSPAFAYGQEGRMALVYKLAREDGHLNSGSSSTLRAFKVFKAAYQTPTILKKAEELRPFWKLPGLQVCARRVLDPNHAAYQPLLEEYPDLAYAVLMPWVEGITWSDIMLQRAPLTREQVWALAWSVASLLASLEEREVAHCDISGSNLMVHWQQDGSANVALVDVEQLYAPVLTPPDALLVGSPGYTPRFDTESLWGPFGDRFAGAVLLAEILGWYHPQVAEYGNEQSFFPAAEVQATSARYRLLIEALSQWPSAFVSLFQRAWEATSLDDCPPLVAWRDAFLENVPADIKSSSVGNLKPAPSIESNSIVSSIAQEFQDIIEQTHSRTNTDTARNNRQVPSPNERPYRANEKSVEDGLAVITNMTENTPVIQQSTALTVSEGHTVIMGSEEETSIAEQPQWYRVFQEAQSAETSKKFDQALQSYLQAIDLAEGEDPQGVTTALDAYNRLLFHQIEALHQKVYRAQLSSDAPRSLEWASTLGRQLAGLSRVQLLFLVGGVAIVAFVVMAMLASLNQESPLAASLSMSAFLLALLLAAFPTATPVVSGLYGAAILFGLLGVSARLGGDVRIVSPVLLGVGGAALASWMGTQLFPPDQGEEISWGRVGWVVSSALLVGLGVEQAAYPYMGKMLQPMNWILNFPLVVGGWYGGRAFRALLVAYRESLS